MNASRLLIMMIPFTAIATSTVAQAASDSATYTYDQNGRLWTVTYANGTTITYTYDTAGNRQQVVTACSAGGC